MNQITHEKDDDGNMRQIVSAETLRKILTKDGGTLAKPKWFGAKDEWDVGDDDAAPRLMDYYTNEDIRPATDEEIEASDDAGPEGVILLAADGSILRADDDGADDAQRVYVAD